MLCIFNFGHYREGKRAAEEVADVTEVKKARLEGDEDVLTASMAELPTNKRTHYSNCLANDPDRYFTHS
jgi:hypothetical protein